MIGEPNEKKDASDSEVGLEADPRYMHLINYNEERGFTAKCWVHSLADTAQIVASRQ